LRNQSIGLCIPAKDTFATHLHATGAVPEKVLQEFYGLLKKKKNLSYQECSIENATVKNGKVWNDNVCLSDFDCVFWYYPMIPEREGYEMQILRTLASTTTVIPNPEGFYRGFDKFTSHTLLRNSEIPTADFALFRSDQLNEARNLLREWGTLLLKSSLGNLGRGIVRVDNEQQLLDIIQYANNAMERPLPVFVERFEENDTEKWISTTIIGETLVYGYRKKAEKIANGWKVYDEKGRGGSAYYVDPSPVAEIVLEAKKILGADIIGFDCIYSTKKKQYLIVDENTFPGMYEECFAKSGKGSWAEMFYSFLMNHVGTH